MTARGIAASPGLPLPLWRVVHFGGPPVIVGIAILALWELLAKASGFSPIVLPAPMDVLRAFNGIEGDLARQAWATGWEAGTAFLLSCVFGAVIALALGYSTILFEAFYPNLLVFQIIPKIALAPLFTFWLGIASPARLSYAVFISIFPVILGTMTGLARADEGALRLCRVLGASRWYTFRAVRLPYALPYFFSGAKIAATLATIGIVIGEFISANDGLGYYILHAQSLSQTANIFDAVIVLCLLGLLLYAVPVVAEHFVRRWWRG